MGNLSFDELLLKDIKMSVFVPSEAIKALETNFTLTTVMSCTILNDQRGEILPFV